MRDRQRVGAGRHGGRAGLDQRGPGRRPSSRRKTRSATSPTPTRSPRPTTSSTPRSCARSSSAKTATPTSTTSCGPTTSTRKALEPHPVVPRGRRVDRAAGGRFDINGFTYIMSNFQHAGDWESPLHDVVKPTLDPLIVRANYRNRYGAAVGYISGLPELGLTRCGRFRPSASRRGPSEGAERGRHPPCRARTRRRRKPSAISVQCRA